MAQLHRPSEQRDVFQIEDETTDIPTGIAMDTMPTESGGPPGGDQTPVEPLSQAFQSDASSPVTDVLGTEAEEDDSATDFNIDGIPVRTVRRVIHKEQVFTAGGEVKEQVTEYTTVADDVDTDRLLKTATDQANFVRQQLLNTDNEFYPAAPGYGQGNTGAGGEYIGSQAFYGDDGGGMYYGSQQPIPGFATNPPYMSGHAGAGAGTGAGYYAAEYPTSVYEHVGVPTATDGGGYGGGDVQFEGGAAGGGKGDERRGV